MSAAPESCSATDAATADTAGRELRGIRDRLVRQFADLPVALVDDCMSTVLQRFEDARIVAFLPILIEKHARLHLAVERQARRDREPQGTLDLRDVPAASGWQRQYSVMQTG